MTALAEAFLCQSRSCAALDSPFMEQLCRLLAERLTPGMPLTDRLFAWEGDLGPRGESVPLRVCGALHALRLSGNAALAAVYPPHKADDDRLWAAIAHVFETHAHDIDRFIDSPPQTNEVRRSAALIPAARLVAARTGLPLRLSELGASAGLNLNFDRFALKVAGRTLAPDAPALTLAPDWTGPPPADAAVQVIERRGVDLNPLDPQRDRLRLRAYLWPDQPHRLTLTNAALALPPAPVDRADAIDWLAPRLTHKAGTCHFIYTTVAWQYFPRDRQAQGLRLIEDAGAQATDNSPLAFFQMENDGAQRGAALTLRLWPGDLSLALGRADFHGRWIAWAG